MATAEKPIASKTIALNDIGPIARLETIVPQFGIVVFKGPNGAGKTTALNALEAAATGKGKPQIRDGADRGAVQLDTVTMQVGKRNRTSGSLEFGILDGRYSIADLIDPGYKDRAACDEHAIKTLAQLAGMGDESLFYDLCGGKAEFEKLCPADVAGSLDVVALAAKIERGLQALARAEEGKAEAADGKADAYSASARDIDVDDEHDADKLQAALHEAIADKSTLEQKHLDATSKLAAAANAREALEDAKAELTAPTVEVAEAKLSKARDILQDGKAQLEIKRREFNEAAALVMQLENAVKIAEQQVESSKSEESLLARFKAQVDAAQNVAEVDPAELAEAAEAVKQAHAAVERGALIRKALEDREQSKMWRHAAAEHRKLADKRRQAAAGTDDVLSGLVATLGTRLFVERGKLMLKTDRGNESFWDLSDGERSEIAATIFATKVGAGGLVVLPQKFWEGQDCQSRKRLNECMIARKVLAITAQCDSSPDDSGELRAEVFSP